MANVKISALPSWTGTAADLRWFVMNNSGQTETFKFSGFTSPFKSGDATNSIIPTYYPSSSATTSGTTYVEKLKALFIVFIFIHPIKMLVIFRLVFLCFENSNNLVFISTQKFPKVNHF